jgi:hypothetical protein
LTSNIDSRLGVAPCACCCWWCPLPLLVFRRLDIHLPEKVGGDDHDELVSLLVEGLLNGMCKSDVSESMIGGASVAGDGREGD